LDDELIFTVKHKTHMLLLKPLPGKSPSIFIGHAKMKVRDLIKRPRRTLLVQNENGDAVVRVDESLDFPHLRPCELVVEIDQPESSLPYDWPVPVESKYDMRQYKKHVLLMTRGTRGDVQPFVALARGLAEKYGWMVTIQTELTFKDFIQGKTNDLSQGIVRFAPSGGDTERRIERPEAQWMMSTKFEAFQVLMMAASEANFYGSLPVYVNHVERSY